MAGAIPLIIHIAVNRAFRSVSRLVFGSSLLVATGESMTTPLVFPEDSADPIQASSTGDSARLSIPSSQSGTSKTSSPPSTPSANSYEVGYPRTFRLVPHVVTWRARRPFLRPRLICSIGCRDRRWTYSGSGGWDTLSERFKAPRIRIAKRSNGSCMYLSLYSLRSSPFYPLAPSFPDKLSC